MQILIAYYSDTGNTAKIGQAIGDECTSAGHSVDVKQIGAAAPAGAVTAGGLSAYDLVFLGSACINSDVAVPVKELMAGISPSPAFRLAGFVTHSTLLPEGGERAAELHERWAGKCSRTYHQVCEEKKVEFLGYFGCMGAPSPGIAAFIRNTIMTDGDEFEMYMAEVSGHPDEGDLRDARAFAREALASL